MANRNVNPLEQFAAIQVPAAPVQVSAVPAPDGPKPAVLDLDLDGFVSRAMIASNRLVEPGKSLFPNGIDKTFPAMKVHGCRLPCFLCIGSTYAILPRCTL